MKRKVLSTAFLLCVCAVGFAQSAKRSETTSTPEATPATTEIRSGNAATAISRPTPLTDQAIAQRASQPADAKKPARKN